MTYQEAADILNINLRTITPRGLKSQYHKKLFDWYPTFNNSPDADAKTRTIIDAYKKLCEYLEKNPSQENKEPSEERENKETPEERMDIPGDWFHFPTNQIQIYLQYIIKHIAEYDVICKSYVSSMYYIVPKTEPADPSLKKDYYLRNDCIRLCIFGGTYYIGGRAIETTEEFRLVDSLYQICEARCRRQQTQQYTQDTQQAPHTNSKRKGTGIFSRWFGRRF